MLVNVFTIQQVERATVRINKNNLDYSLKRDTRLNVGVTQNSNVEKCLANGVCMDPASKSIPEIANGNTQAIVPFDNLVRHRVAKSPR